MSLVTTAMPKCGVVYALRKQMPNKKILILNCHPDKGSLIDSLALEYKRGCEAAGFDFQFVRLVELDIDWIMKKERRDPKNWEPEIRHQQQLITWCEHLVIVSPNWWWNMPALLKGYIDRVFTYGFASDYKDTFPYVIPLLSGRSARVIYTQNTSKLIGILGRGDRFWKNINISVLRHCGFRPTARTAIGPVKGSTDEVRKKWLQTVFELGRNGQ